VEKEIRGIERLQGIILALKESNLFTSIEVIELIEEESVKLLRVKAKVLGELPNRSKLRGISFTGFLLHHVPTETTLAGFNSRSSCGTASRSHLGSALHDSKQRTEGFVKTSFACRETQSKGEIVMRDIIPYPSRVKVISSQPQQAAGYSDKINRGYVT